MRILTKNIFTITVTTVAISLLTACGDGDGEKNAQTHQSIKPQDKIGELLTLGEKERLTHKQLHNKTYYARFAFCANANCTQISNGVMHFKIVDNAQQLNIQDLHIDASGVSTQLSDYTINYQPTNSNGEQIELSDNQLTALDSDRRIYQLKLTPITTTSLPDVNIDLLISNDGNTIVSADDDYLFVAQQRSQAPNNWTAPVSKSGLGGGWKSILVDNEDMVKATAQVTVDTGEIGYGAAKFNMVQNGKQHWGVYKNSGYGYAFGYTDGEVNSNFSNYNGIHGVMITSPDNSFGVGYDASEDGGAFLLTK